VVKRAAALALFALTACNAIIGLDSPRVLDGGELDNAPEGDAAPLDDTAPGSTNAPGDDAGEPRDGSVATGDGSADGPVDTTLSSGDAAQGADATAPLPDTGPGGPPDSFVPIADTAAADTEVADSGPVDPTVILVNAARLATPVAFCVGLSSPGGGPLIILPTQPYPYSAGLFTGHGVAAPRIAGLAYQDATLFVFLDVSKFPTDPCDHLLGTDGDGGLSASSAYIRLPAFAAGTFGNRTTSVIAIVGCPAGVTVDGGSPPGCGDGGVSNLAAIVDTVPVVTPPSYDIHVFHAAPALACFSALQCAEPEMFDVTPGLDDPPLHTVAYAEDTNLGPISPGDASQISAVLTVPLAAGGEPTWQWSFATIAGASGQAPFNDGHDYVFVLTGDPSAPAGEPLAVTLLGFPLDIAPGLL
jgi:hypothetical protein